MPSELELCQPEASGSEISSIADIHKRFGAAPNYDLSKLRAFRLLSGARRYLEIGTFDKANLAYLSKILAPDALIIDLDIEENIKQDRMLDQELYPDQTICRVRGNSAAKETVQSVRSAVGDEPLDAIFIDANHMAKFVLADFANYSPMVKKDGYILFHDIQWEGAGTTKGSGKGVAQALEIIHKYVPVYQVVANNPVTRFFSPVIFGPIWGGMGIVLARDL